MKPIPWATATRIVTEPEFRAAMEDFLSSWAGKDDVGAVTGPGRSGAVAAVYASHMLGVPFIPFKATHPSYLGRLLIIDTATQTGRTLRRAASFYKAEEPFAVALFNEPPRVAFWYEAPKPQRYRHEQPRRA